MVHHARIIIIKNAIRLNSILNTLLFSEIHTIRFDKGKHRKTIGMMQSTAYVFMVAMLRRCGYIVGISKITYDHRRQRRTYCNNNIHGCRQAGVTFSIRSGYKVNNQLKKKRTIKWKIEVL